MAFDLSSLLQMILGNSGVADVLGGAAKAGQAQNNTADTLALSQGNLALNRDKFATAAPSQRMSDSLRASLLNNYTPRKTIWAGPGSGLRGEVPQITGGLSAGLSNLDPRTKQLDDQVLSDSLAAQMKGGETGGGRDRYTAPVAQSSTGDKLLGGAALGTSLANALLGGGKNGGGSGGELPIQQLIDLFKKKPGIATPDTGTGVLQNPGEDLYPGLGGGTGPTLPVGPQEGEGSPYGGGFNGGMPHPSPLDSHGLTTDNGQGTNLTGFTPEDILSYLNTDQQNQPQEDPRNVSNGYDEDLRTRL